jgi:hypothetical protein
LKRLDLGLNESIDFSQRVEGLLRYGEVHTRTVRPTKGLSITERQDSNDPWIDLPKNQRTKWRPLIPRCRRSPFVQGFEGNTP